MADEHLHVVVKSDARTYWQFGDIVRVDPTTNPQAPQPDDRRWMVLVPATVSANRQWTFMALPSGIVSHWSSAHGFVKVDE